MSRKTCRTGDHAVVKGKSYTKTEYVNEQARLKEEGINDPAFATPFDKLPGCDLEPEYPDDDPTPGM